MLHKVRAALNMRYQMHLCLQKTRAGASVQRYSAAIRGSRAEAGPRFLSIIHSTAKWAEKQDCRRRHDQVEAVVVLRICAHLPWH